MIFICCYYNGFRLYRCGCSYQRFGLELQLVRPSSWRIPQRGVAGAEKTRLTQPAIVATMVAITRLTSPCCIHVFVFIFPQQRQLMGSSAQIASVCAGAGRRSRFRRKVPESSGVCRCRFRRKVPEEGSGGRFRRVPVCAGVGSGG